jgi:predicted RNA-binding Zn ribbon-like protein
VRANMKEDGRENSSLDFVGDHIAINFINTWRMDEGVLTDTVESDEHVIAWMRKMNLRLPLIQKPLRPKELLRAARDLRSLASRSIEQRKAGKHVSLDGLNTFLADAISHLELGTRERRINLERVYVARDARQFLAPLAEAIADLLANGDFSLVRHCEGERCVLWFYDRTKGHRRRWCTAQGCGTRTRVAAFRARRASASD